MNSKFRVSKCHRWTSLYKLHEVYGEVTVAINFKNKLIFRTRNQMCLNGVLDD
jgi:hypothetical protein